jgi:arylformamidase
MKGPRVFLDYDQAELDAAYDQDLHASNREQIAERNLANSKLACSRIGEPRRLAYGSVGVEHLDLYATARSGAPIFVFVHGGGWRSMGIARYGFAAEPFVNAGAHFAAVQFSGVDQTGGDLRPLIDQVRRAIAWIHANAPSFNGDADRIYVGGHSSGAHLASALTITDWNAYGLPADVLKGALCCSGMYDLDPVRRSKRSEYVRFDDEIVETLSPRRHVRAIDVPMVVAVGALESPEFQRQAREFVGALWDAGKAARSVIGRGYNHFELIETLGNPYGVIGAAALTLMQLATG